MAWVHKYGGGLDKRGADVSVKNKDGNTALKIATEINDQKKITSLLVEAGAVK